MRYAVIAFVVLLSAGAASAQDYTSSEYCDPWCMHGPRSGAFDCTFRTLEQCVVASRGLGGHCVTNPFLSYCQRGPAAAARRAPRRRDD
jgi:hypothetical protein